MGSSQRGSIRGHLPSLAAGLIEMPLSRRRLGPAASALSLHLVLADAIAAFGTAETAVDWRSTPTSSLDGTAPPRSGLSEFQSQKMTGAARAMADGATLGQGSRLAFAGPGGGQVSSMRVSRMQRQSCRLSLAGLPPWDADPYPLVFQFVSRPIGITTPATPPVADPASAARARRRQAIATAGLRDRVCGD